MSIQHQRVVELCNELRLSGNAAQYTALAQKAAEMQTTRLAFYATLALILFVIFQLSRHGYQVSPSLG